MAITTLSSLRSLSESAQRVPIYKAPLGAVNSRFGTIYDYWTATGQPANGSTTAVGNAGVLLDRTSQGAMPIVSPSAGNQLFLLSANFNAIWDTRSAGSLQLPPFAGLVHVWDRLWYNDSIISNSTARRSWSPPALTRSVSGEGLSIWYRHGAGGSGAGIVTYTLEYTNSQGVAQTSTYTWDHGGLSQIGIPSQMIPVPLVLGDTGVRAVTAVTQSAAIISGSYGFTIQRYLGAYPIQIVSGYPSPSSIFAGLPAIDGSAHLTFGIQMGPPYVSTVFVASTAPAISGEILIVEG